MQARQPLRILHWNVHSWDDESGAPNVGTVADLINESMPDVVSLAEVDEPWGLPTTLNNLAGRLGYAWIFAPSFEFGHEIPEGGFGNALLAKLPIIAVHQWQLIWPPRLYDGTEPSEARSIVFGKFNFFGAPVWVGSTHLPRADAVARTKALRRLASSVRGLDGPWLVCGDFNTPLSAWPDEFGPTAVCPEPPQATYPAGKPVEAIDYCIASPGLAMEGNVLPVGGSDHLPLIVSAQLTDGS